MGSVQVDVYGSDKMEGRILLGENGILVAIFK